MKEQTDEYDSPWKEILETYFRDFVEFFFPEVAQGIDWKKGYTFLDKEFQKAVRDAKLGTRFADKLVQVWKKNGDKAWVLAHVEVQGQYESKFSKRIFVYNYRIFDRYDRPVASLVVLADERPKWRPVSYSHELWGCKVSIEFPVVKLADYKKRWKELEKSDNPFAFAVMAHLKTQETRHNTKDRRRWKVYLIRKLYEHEYDRKDIINIFRFIDWLMKLPEEAEKSFWEEVCQYEEEKKMRYVTTGERIGYKRGKLEGKLEAIELGLSIRFGDDILGIMGKIQKIQDVERLKAIKDAIKTARNFSEMRKIIEKRTSDR
ncbi:hypothetical protein QUF76_11160 [Desulfobacterales bacterium HSG16]|nr:hypothetical protein [Desulfobacterales bacterium HSG16]